MAIQTLKDWYGVLEVVPTATQEEVKRAYRRKAFVCHPDRGGSAFRMKAVNEAWAVLGDADLRRQYDAEVREELGRERREGGREDARTADRVVVMEKAAVPSETFITDLGRVGMVVAFRLGRGFRSVVRFIRRFLKF
jgi:curved DNA-binding protein CbpA